MTRDADDIASIVLDEFDKLPAKRKPAVRDNGCHEWVPLSGVVARVGNGPFRCLSLGTGMKCLPASKLPLANGVGIHDWHAEILAIRAFNHFVLQECRNIAIHGQPSDYLRLRESDEVAVEETVWHGQPFAWRDGVTLHMYCSEAPCGDASMELTMAAQDDASPWELPPATPPSSSPDTTTASGPLPGRAYFSQLGVVRRKPARGDAPQTLSKSCSDKLALRQCTSLLSSLASLIVSPRGVYLGSLVLPESRHSGPACERSFSARGRMAPLAGESWPGGYAFAPFAVETTTRQFSFSKRSIASRSDKASASNLAVAWSAHGRDEGLVGGVLQGRRPFDRRGACMVSRRKMWALGLEIAGLLGAGCCAGIQRALAAPSYQDVKDDHLLEGRRRVKEDAKTKALVGWVSNAGDSEFALEGP